MDEDKQCGYCLHFLLDTTHLPRQHACDYYHRRIIGLEVPKWCKAYAPIVDWGKLREAAKDEANNGR